MNIINTLNSWIFKRLPVIVSVLASYAISIFILNDYALTLVAVICVVSAIIFLLYARAYLYFMIFTYPIMGLIQTYIPLSMGGGYTGFNIGGIFVIMGVVYGVMYFILRRPRIFQYELTIAIIIFLVDVLVSISYVPAYKLFSLREWLRLVTHVPLYFIILNEFRSLKGARKLLNLLFCLSATYYTYFVTTVFFPVLRPGIMRSVTADLSTEITRYRLAGFMHENSLGSLLVIFFAFTLFYFFESPIQKKWKYVLFLITTLIGLLNTLSRNSWGAFVIVVFVIGVLRYRKFLLILCLMGIFVLLATPDIMEIIRLRMQPDTSALHRLTLIDMGWKLFIQKPLLGWGQGYFHIWSGTNLGSTSIQYGVGGLDLHNEYIRMLVETGIVGFFCFSYLMCRGFKIAYKLFILPIETAKNYSMFSVAMIITILINGVTGQGFRDMAFYFWVYLAIGEIMLRSFQSNEHEAEPEKIAE